MAEDGYTDIVAADLSRVVLAKLQIRCENYPEVSFFQGTM